MLWSLPLLALASSGAQAAPSPASIHLETKSDIDSQIANVHVTYLRPVEEEHIVTYGSCKSFDPREAHHEVIRTSQGSDRMVWVIPEDAVSGGCLSAWSSSSKLLGRSAPVQMKKRRMRKRDSIPMTNSSGIDAEGPWFDGVATLKNHNISSVDAKHAKDKKIAIIGAGMAGLMTYLNLKDAGFENVVILEASERVGGRLRTDYFGGGPWDYHYQEMGPMRFPLKIKYPDTNETVTINDHHIVFQLAETLNQINKGSQEHNVSFIPFYQHSRNSLSYTDGIRKADGTVPTVTEVAQNSSLAPPKAPESPEEKKAENILDSILYNSTFMTELGKNVYKAHKEYLDAYPGGDDWSEFAYLHNYLKFSLNVTEAVLSGDGETSFWGAIYDNEYLGACTWVTVDGGLSRLSEAFFPIVDKNIRFKQIVQKLDYKDDQVTVSWKNEYTDEKVQSEVFDYAIVAAPFSVVRGWRLPKFSPLLNDAIKKMPYGEACKVALEFQTRFWEHLDQPIIGGCDTVDDIPGIGNTCYPSYKVNSTGPGVMLSSYESDGITWVGYSEEEHVKYVLDAMAELHGDIVYEQYTGKYSRKCWAMDRFQLGSWASPEIGQHKAWIPSYFNTENNVIFVGEHTSYTHAWIASALESGVRGSVQLLLKLGLVDEAKKVNKQWMARWIDV
ncbi:anthranilate synthase component 1 [Ascosphaera pollenicola]|nr:anthranilate synthase component 1 [Ascosphaera pollenicola]